jgi:hypothetical protein
MRRNNNRRRVNRNNNNNKRGTKTMAPMLQLSNRMNIFNRLSGTTVNIILPATIYSDMTTGNVSFSAANVDTRFLSFGQIAASSFPFGNYSSVYSEYRIKSASVIVCPVNNNTQQLAITHSMLYLTCDPEIVSAVNPINSTILGTQSAHLFSIKQIMPKSVSFTFPGVGLNTHLWLPVNSLPTGSFYIGSNTNSNVFGSIAILYDVSISFQVDFREVKAH